MKKTLLLSAIILQSIIANAQKFEWLSHSSQASVPGAEEYAPVAVDPAGNIYTAIQTSSTGIVIQGDTFPSLNGQNAVIIVKLDPAGNLIWGKTISGDNGSEARKIAVDDAGAIYISAIVLGVNTIMNDTIYANPSQIQFIKIDSNGNFIRTQHYSGSSYEVWNLATLGTDLYMSRSQTVQKMDSAFNVI
ncbi:MAG: hypothetical protein ABI855_04015, partial [Bacteroidota bacterium]